MNARPSLAGTAATGDKALAQALTIDQAMREFDGDAAISEMSFQELLELRDEASEHGDWLGAAEIDCELRARRAEAVGKLSGLFVQAVTHKTFVPMTGERGIEQVPIAEYLSDAFNANDGSDKAVRMALGENVIAEMATDYASEFCEDLLRAGWAQ